MPLLSGNHVIILKTSIETKLKSTNLIWFANTVLASHLTWVLSQQRKQRSYVQLQHLGILSWTTNSISPSDFSSNFSTCDAQAISSNLQTQLPNIRELLLISSPSVNGVRSYVHRTVNCCEWLWIWSRWRRVGMEWIPGVVLSIRHWAWISVHVVTLNPQNSTMNISL